MDTYDPKEVIVVVGGFTISGFAEDTFVEIERNEDAFALQVGADGKGVRTKSANKSGTFKIRLQPTSPSNTILDTYANADEANGSGAVPVLVKDNRGNDLHVAEQAWVKKKPNRQYGGAKAENLEWVLESDNINSILAGYSV